MKKVGLEENRTDKFGWKGSRMKNVGLEGSRTELEGWVERE